MPLAFDSLGFELRVTSGKTLSGLKGLTCEKAKPESKVRMEIERFFFIGGAIELLKIETGIKAESTAQKKTGQSSLVFYDSQLERTITSLSKPI